MNENITILTSENSELKKTVENQGKTLAPENAELKQALQKQTEALSKLVVLFCYNLELWMERLKMLKREEEVMKTKKKP